VAARYDQRVMVEALKWSRNDLGVKAMGIAAESLHMFCRGLVVRLQSRGKVERTEYIFVRHIRYDTCGSFLWSDEHACFYI